MYHYQQDHFSMNSSYPFHRHHQYYQQYYYPTHHNVINYRKNIEKNYSYSTQSHDQYSLKFKRGNQIRKQKNVITKQRDKNFQNPIQFWTKSARKYYGFDEADNTNLNNLQEEQIENYEQNEFNENRNVVPFGTNNYRRGKFSQNDIEHELYETSEQEIQDYVDESLNQQHFDDIEHESSGQHLLQNENYEHEHYPQTEVEESHQQSGEHRFILRRIGPKYPPQYLRNKQYQPSQFVQNDDGSTLLSYYYTQQTQPLDAQKIELNEKELSTTDKDDGKILQDSKDVQQMQNNPNLDDVSYQSSKDYGDAQTDVKGYFGIDGAWYPYPEDLYKRPSDFGDVTKIGRTWTSKQAQKQLEHWFSDINLSSDRHLRNLMDSDGWVEVSQIVKFPRMQTHGVDVDKIIEASHHSLYIDVHPDGNKIRSKSYLKNPIHILQVSKDDINKIVDDIMEKYQKTKDKSTVEKNVKSEVSQNQSKKNPDNHVGDNNNPTKSNVDHDNNNNDNNNKTITNAISQQQQNNNCLK